MPVFRYMELNKNLDSIDYPFTKKAINSTHTYVIEDASKYTWFTDFEYKEGNGTSAFLYVNRYDQAANYTLDPSGFVPAS